MLREWSFQYQLPANSCYQEQTEQCRPEPPPHSPSLPATGGAAAHGAGAAGCHLGRSLRLQRGPSAGTGEPRCWVGGLLVILSHAHAVAVFVGRMPVRGVRDTQWQRDGGTRESRCVGALTLCMLRSWTLLRKFQAPN